ncbi:MAG: glycosyltransferase [Kiritimatiellae bacterium]|nr:glycosyltransferase [Kiritimatiellia bacterium]
MIPTLGRPTVVQTVESLVAARGFESIEVFVAGAIPEGAVLDRLNALITKYPWIRHLPVFFAKGDSSEKKNAGWREGRADIVAFLDDDVVVAPDWPERILEPFADAKVGLVSGPGLVPEDISLIGHLAGTALQSHAAGYVSQRYLAGGTGAREIKWSRIIGCNMAYRRSVIEEIGGFDAGFWPGEEMIAAFHTQQRGYKLMFQPQASVYHYPRQSLGRFWKQMHGYGATRIRLIRAGVEFEPATIVPGIWVLSLVVLAAAAAFASLFSWLLLADVVLYLLAAAVITLIKFADTQRPVDLLIFFLIPVMHLSYGIAEWVEFLRPDKDLSEAGAQGADD